MKCVLSQMLIVCLFAPQAPFEASGTSGQSAGAPPWHLSDVRRVLRHNGASVEELKGELVSDQSGKRLRFESSGPGLEVPYDRIVAMHYEADTLRVRALSGLQTAHYLTIFFSNPRDQDSVATFRLPADTAAAVLDALESDTGARIDRTPPRRSFLGLPIRLGVGDMILVTDAAGQTTTGTVSRLTATSIALNGSTPSPREFADSAVRRISRTQPERRSTNPRAKWWAGVGAAVGAVYGGIVSGFTGALQGAVVWGALWGVIGAGVNAVSAAPGDFDVYIAPP